MGWLTDPYQPCEVDMQQTRAVLETLFERGFSASILTKSDLLLRDLDILSNMNQAAVSFSVAFADDRTRQLLEMNTMDTKARIEAMKECKRAGVRTSAMICPVIPYINDPLPIVEQVKSHVDRVWVYGLSILDASEGNWQDVRSVLKKHFPELYPAARDAIFGRDHPYWKDLRNALLDEYSDMDFELTVRL